MRSFHVEISAPRTLKLATLIAVLGLAWARAAVAADDVQTAQWTFPSHVSDVSIPAAFSADGQIVVRMTVKGRGLDLVLDTGVSDDQLDGSIYDWLGLGRSGDQCAAVDGVHFGAMVADHLRFCRSSVYRHDETNHLVVGLLGYDFLRDAVVRVDYEHATVRIIDPAAFSIPKGASRFDQFWGDTRPIVPARVGTSLGSSFILDTGSGTTTVFPQFADAHPAEFATKGTAKKHLPLHFISWPRGVLIPEPSDETIYFWPLCGRTELDPYSIPLISLGTLNVRDAVVWRVPASSCFRVAGADGLIGYDILRLFNVYIDFPQRLILLQPNASYATVDH